MDKKIYNQDLHIHTEYSYGDRAVIKGMTVGLVDWLRHAKVIGISDHFEYIAGKRFDLYREEVKKYGFFCGTEVDGYYEAKKAIYYDFDYYMYHCFDKPKYYKGIDVLLSSGKPVIIAHPYAIGTDLNKVPSACYVEINNRYIWRSDWKTCLTPFLDKFKYILSSDAHQPNWLNLEIAIQVCNELDISESLIFQI